MVSFDQSGQIVDQISGQHHGLLEIYAHLYASMFLFAVSTVSIFLLYYYFRHSIFKYLSLVNGIFYTGLIGLGEALEHFFSDPVIGSTFHYLHLFAAPLALIFYLLSLGDIFGKDAKAERKVDAKKTIAIFIAMLFITLILSSFSDDIWDTDLEVPLVLITAGPALILVGIVLEKSKIISESTLLLSSLRLILLGVSFLTISILAGRYADIVGNAKVYIIAHQIQNISHIATGTAILIMVVTILQVEKVIVSAAPK